MTVEVTLPDGGIKSFDNPVTGFDIAKSIGSKLAKDAICIEIDNNFFDLSTVFDKNISVRIVTNSDPDALHILRHSSAHILAQAVLNLYPDAKYGVGPSIENGFYYDFLFNEPLKETDLIEIEKEMVSITKSSQEFNKSEISKKDAKKIFKEQSFKIELITSAESEEGVSGDSVTMYSNDDFNDLCKGPHIPNTKYLKHFKLTKLGGAYWRGDEDNPQLQRIYGTSWFTKKDLDEYLVQQEEAEKRDHRKLGNELNLFTTSNELGSGNFLWKPKGAILRDLIETYSKNAHLNNGYDLVNTPHIGKSILWETSGHLKHYKENMFPPIVHEENDETYYLKPMNCPFHILVYKSDLHSYKELPLRYFEFGSVYRYEKTGVLHGLLRLRGFTQDDAHIFCTNDQINSEVKTLLNFSVKLLNSFGLFDIEADLSTKPKKYIGSDEDWEVATDSLKNSLTELNIPFATAKGEGAFYGPKIDLHAKDAIGRRWQLSTIQIDFAQPQNFDIEYVNTDNKKVRPVMIHRALLGSVERFTGVLIEHYAGHMPGWLSPVQIDVLTIGNVTEYIDQINEKLSGYRINIDDRNIRLGEKIHSSQKNKTPIQVIVGENDINSFTVALNIYNKDNLKDVPLEDAIKIIKTELKEPEFTING
jgi:threonyl-tRNA synthetase|tara:strand:- start:37 stop:1974 length:1938 start_codon:yes stop_codon:yes gene_type:complete